MSDENSFAPIPSWRPRHVSVATIALAFLAVITFFLIASEDVSDDHWANGDYPYSGRMDYADAIPLPALTTREATGYGGAIPPSILGSSGEPSSMQDTGFSAKRGGGGGSQGPSTSADYASYAPNYPYSGGDVAVSDARELLKINYTASMHTRDVAGLTRRVETTVRGYDGRIDQISVSPNYGHVSFVVPMSKYDAFRTELESMVNNKFFTVDIQSSNLLPQKQGIEEQQKNADKTLSEYQSSRLKIVDTHASAIKSLQSKIDANTAQLPGLRAKPATYDLQMQIQGLLDEVALLKQQLTYENVAHKSQLESVDDSIKYVKEWQTAVKTQDQNLIDNVATVNGSVSIDWISLWDMGRTCLPGYWIPTFFAILAILSFLYDRQRFGTV